MSKFNPTEIIPTLIEKFGQMVTTKELKSVSGEIGISLATLNKNLKLYKVGRGVFDLSTYEKDTMCNTGHTDNISAPCETPVTSLIPEKDSLYVPWGNFKDIETIIKSKTFMPLYIQGLSGNGKTQSVEQVCAKLGRELIRVNFTLETDESDLIGGFRLLDGNTVFHYGPVVDALQRGAVLLLDEVDLASSKVLCLQSILEGKGLYIKKTGEFVQPAPGFNIVACANTKGKGSDDGRFIGANVQNEAFLDRFAVTFEQSYPNVATERKIMTRLLVSLGQTECLSLVENLTDWASIIRTTFTEGGIDDVISTRRLASICKAFMIWGDINKAIQLCCNRFDDDTKGVFLELFQKVSGEVSTDTTTPETITTWSTPPVTL